MKWLKNTIENRKKHNEQITSPEGGNLVLFYCDKFKNGMVFIGFYAPVNGLWYPNTGSYYRNDEITHFAVITKPGVKK